MPVSNPVTPSPLAAAQYKFTRMVADLIIYAYAQGYTLSFAEAYRTPEQAALNAKKGTGSANSLHCRRLAVDLNVFRDGKYLSATPDLTPLGEYWESIGGAWGGRFRDGNHFSLAFEGMK
jgi:hypothetical protein